MIDYGSFGIAISGLIILIVLYRAIKERQLNLKNGVDVNGNA